MTHETSSPILRLGAKFVPWRSGAARLEDEEGQAKNLALIALAVGGAFPSAFSSWPGLSRPSTRHRATDPEVPRFPAVSVPYSESSVFSGMAGSSPAMTGKPEMLTYDQPCQQLTL